MIVVALCTWQRPRLMAYIAARWRETGAAVMVSMSSATDPHTDILDVPPGVDITDGPNRPLGAKFNRLYRACRHHDASHVLLWSDDCIPAPGALDAYHELIDADVDAAGLTGLVYATADRFLRFAGYDPDVRDEPIGVGRLLSRRVLEDLSWTPFAATFDRGLDASTTGKLHRAGYQWTKMDPVIDPLLNIRCSPSLTRLESFAPGQLVDCDPAAWMLEEQERWFRTGAVGAGR